MEGIQHRTVTVNGIKMHIAEKGKGPVVLLLHGFPELWYSWKHQIISLAASGYRAVAPDLRGYGDTDAPTDVQSYTSFNIVADIVALIDVLGQDKVFVVGHDWGAIMTWYLCLYHPERVKAVVNLSVSFTPRIPLIRPVESLRLLYGDDYYVIRFQSPGEMEAEFVRVGTATILRKFLTYHNSDPLYIPKDRNWELNEQWTGAQVKVPVKFIVGDQDLSYHIPGVKYTYTAVDLEKMFHSWRK